MDNYEQVDNSAIKNYLSNPNINQFPNSSFAEADDDPDGAPGINDDLKVGHLAYPALMTEELHDE